MKTYKVVKLTDQNAKFVLRDDNGGQEILLVSIPFEIKEEGKRCHVMKSIKKYGFFDNKNLSKAKKAINILNKKLSSEGLEKTIEAVYY